MDGDISARVNGEDTNTMNQEESEDIVAFDEQGPSFSEPYVSLRHANETMTSDERRKKRLQRKVKEEHGRKLHGGSGGSRVASDALTDGRFAEMLTKNEDELLKFVAQVNKVYQEKLKKPAPFMTFVFCGMQSAGKSTIMERFMNAVLNIIQEGTGTRCPLDTTCIHDDLCSKPSCDLSGNELVGGGDNLLVEDVFKLITEHNKKLGDEDRFSTEPLYLVFRSKSVQNMRFVDTPGIISNLSTGKDNRAEIQTILRSEMRKPNTKVCVLLEPKEFATNAIIEFCDTTFGAREKWINDATFMMTKFDKQLEDSRAVGKANTFFKEFQNNKCNPHLVITPTLAKEDLPPDELFKARRDLLATADKVEEERFNDWLEGHDHFRQQHGGSEMLSDSVRTKIGFSSAKKVMREVMLEDTAKRLPEVLHALRKELLKLEKEQKTLLEKEKFNDPKELKVVVSQVLYEVEQRIISYLDGDLECSMKFPEKLQTLDDEIDEEEESEWSKKELNHYTEAEDQWRDRIANFEGNYPEEVQADNRFLGGKQVQRAIEFFRAVMIDSLPDPFEMIDLVPNVTGYLGGGLQRENWERAMVQFTRVCVKDVSHPGINYLIKHVGTVFRRLFSLALDDVKMGEEFSATFKMLPTAVEKYLVCEFDSMLWGLMENVSSQTHGALEPMYSTVDPNLPTFHPNRLGSSDEEERYVKRADNSYERLPSKKEQDEESFLEAAKNRMKAFFSVSASGDKAKELLKQESAMRATNKRSFLPDERTSMITAEESEKILRRAFEYIVALMEFNLVTLKFQMNHYLYEGFKKELGRSFKSKLVNDADWDKLVERDPSVSARLGQLKGQITSLKESLQEVNRMQQRM